MKKKIQLPESVTFISKKMVKVELSGQSLFMINTKVIVRMSGRKRHLSQYIRGFISGVLTEVFIGVVKLKRSFSPKLIALNFVAKSANWLQKTFGNWDSYAKSQVIFV